MKKKLGILLIILPIIAILGGIGKLYIAYNLASYSGYYVQHMPRKKGTNPELAILVDNIDFIFEPNREDTFFDLDGNGSIQHETRDMYITLSRFKIDPTSKYILDDFTKKKAYTFSDTGGFRYYYTNTRCAS